MWEFQKNKEFIVINDHGIIHSILTYDSKNFDCEVVITFPTLNIHFQPIEDSTEAILKTGKASLEAYFKYWVINKGLREFIDHMLDLGFTLKKIDKEDASVRRASATRSKRNREISIDFSYT